MPSFFAPGFGGGGDYFARATADEQRRQAEAKAASDARAAAQAKAASQYVPPSGVTGFNLNPSPQSGVGPYGAVPGQLGVPNPAGDLAKQIPIGALNAGMSRNLISGFAGELPPDVIAQIQDNTASFGVTSGMPQSGLSRSRGLRDIGRTSLDQQHWAASTLPGFVQSTSATQTVNPALQHEIALQNAIHAAAPNPAQAAAESERLYNKYLSSMQGSRGGGGGGGGNQFQAPQYQRPTPSSGTASLDPYSFFRPTAPAAPASASPGEGWGYTWNSSQNPWEGTGIGNVPANLTTPQNKPAASAPGPLTGYDAQPWDPGITFSNPFAGYELPDIQTPLAPPVVDDPMGWMDWGDQFWGPDDGG